MSSGSWLSPPPVAYELQWEAEGQITFFNAHVLHIVLRHWKATMGEISPGGKGRDRDWGGLPDFLKFQGNSG